MRLKLNYFFILDPLTIANITKTIAIIRNQKPKLYSLLVTIFKMIRIQLATNNAIFLLFIITILFTNQYYKKLNCIFAFR
ncbi:hypothetical protein BTO15_04550 [Polaribacter sejongensis]|uniref:Transmembrane protein n=1 Tax=Polaribacter sejongensis TaxID=985043 RepID=A0ABN5F2A6_9FLAO|nr:hypothetical protein BTO15_04550 [Polaribacter sejongensis]